MYVMYVCVYSGTALLGPPLGQIEVVRLGGGPTRRVEIPLEYVGRDSEGWSVGRGGPIKGVVRWERWSY